MGAGVLLAGACGDGAAGGGDAGDAVADGGARFDAPLGAPTYRTQTLSAVGSGGYQTALAVRGNKLALVTLSSTTSSTPCALEGRQPVAVPSYDLWYAESTGGGAFVTRKVTTEGYLALTGVGLALDAAGTASVAYTGGPAAEGRCGATDLMLRTGGSGGFGAGTMLAAGSQSTALVPDQAASCVQDVCNSGDATGYWPAIGFRPAGGAANQMAIAFRDLHFGWAADDFQSSDVELYTPAAITTIDVSRGGGTYARIGFAPSGDAVVAHYNGERASAQGIWVHREVAGQWSAKRVTTARAGEQLGFAVAPNGRISIAYYDPDLVKLSYVESTNGTTWSSPEDVSTDGITGQFPSLAIDAAGEPAIAYYRCNDYHPTNRTCDGNKDGLYLARRSGGVWTSHPVVAAPGAMEGSYPALGFVAGKAVIAHQVRTFDPGTGTTTYRLDVSWEN